MNKTWVIADTHFYHNNIIGYTSRKDRFDNVNEVNELIISNWNKVIKNGHDVFVLGDFALTNKDKITELCDILNGNKTLILGNHDNHSAKYYKECGFDNVSKYPVVYRDFYILSHQPIYLNSYMPYVNIHGHTHDTIQQCMVDSKNLYYNVCVENTDYKPIDFSKILTYYQK